MTVRGVRFYDQLNDDAAYIARVKKTLFVTRSVAKSAFTLVNALISSHKKSVREAQAAFNKSLPSGYPPL